LLRDALADEGIDPARSLVKIACAAEKKDDLALAAECWGKLVHFVYPKPRPIVIDPDALVDLEERIASARADAIARKGWHPLNGLADHMERLARAQRAGERASADPVRPAEPTPEPEPAVIEPVAEPHPISPPVQASAPAPSTPYAPILPPATWPDAMSVALVNYDPMKD
jgi:hypothetical protein